jgi:hypothetical protein
VIINSQGGIIQQNVPINQNRNIQGGYGQPQVNVNTQRGGYVQPQFLFQASNPNYGLGTKHEEDKPPATAGPVVFVVLIPPCEGAPIF